MYIGETDPRFPQIPPAHTVSPKYRSAIMFAILSLTELMFVRAPPAILSPPPLQPPRSLRRTVSQRGAVKARDRLPLSAGNAKLIRARGAADRARPAGAARAACMLVVTAAGVLFGLCAL